MPGRRRRPLRNDGNDGAGAAGAGRQGGDAAAGDLLVARVERRVAGEEVACGRRAGCTAALILRRLGEGDALTCTGRGGRRKRRGDQVGEQLIAHDHHGGYAGCRCDVGRVRVDVDRDTFVHLQQGIIDRHHRYRGRRSPGRYRHAGRDGHVVDACRRRSGDLELHFQLSVCVPGAAERQRARRRARFGGDGLGGNHFDQRRVRAAFGDLGRDEQVEPACARGVVDSRSGDVSRTQRKRFGQLVDGHRRVDGPQHRDCAGHVWRGHGGAAQRPVAARNGRAHPFARRAHVRLHGAAAGRRPTAAEGGDFVEHVGRSYGERFDIRPGAAHASGPRAGVAGGKSRKNPGSPPRLDVGQELRDAAARGERPGVDHDIGRVCRIAAGGQKPLEDLMEGRGETGSVVGPGLRRDPLGAGRHADVRAVGIAADRSSGRVRAVTVEVVRVRVLAVGIEPARRMVALVARGQVRMRPIHAGVEAAHDCLGAVVVGGPHFRRTDHRDVPFGRPGCRLRARRARRRRDHCVGPHLQHVVACRQPTDDGFIGRHRKPVEDPESTHPPHCAERLLLCQLSFDADLAAICAVLQRCDERFHPGPTRRPGQLGRKRRRLDLLLHLDDDRDRLAGGRSAQLLLEGRV